MLDVVFCLAPLEAWRSSLTSVAIRYTLFPVLCRSTHRSLLIRAAERVKIFGSHPLTLTNHALYPFSLGAYRSSLALAAPRSPLSLTFETQRSPLPVPLSE